MHELDPRELADVERYKLLIGCIVPRPIAVVSTVSTTGRHNLAPFSFFCPVGATPMTVAFCPSALDDGEDKDSLRNAAPLEEGGTGEFVVSVATEPLIREVAAAAESLPHGESEFELVGLTPVPSRLVGPPRVAQSPVAFECRTLSIVRTAPPGTPGAGALVLGQVVHIAVDDALVNDRLHVDPAVLAAVGRMGGSGYATTRDRFDLARGRTALDQAHPLD